MTVTPATRPRPPRPFVLGARRVYLIAAGFFAAGIVLQVFFAGLGVLVNSSYFAWHTTFAHLLELLLFLLLVLGVVGRVGWRTFGASVLVLVLFGLQYTFMYGVEGSLRALHVVNALALFWLALQLGQGAGQLLRTPKAGGGAKTSGRRVSVGHLLAWGGAILLGIVVLGAVVLVGTTFDNGLGLVSPESPPSGSSAETSAETPAGTSVTGEPLYAQHCIGCHGAAGDGSVGPALAGNGRLEDGAFVIERLLNGRGAMPAWEGVLSDEQIAAVGSFIRTGLSNDFGPLTARDVAGHK